MEALKQEIDEWHDTIREMEIDLRDTIHEAILDREELNRRMLEGRIDLENELLEVLTRRYEKERDELLEIARLKKDTLNHELEMLDEQLEARKRLNEEEDREEALAELEEQLARISADPTRKKEELALREEIAQLREEIAWDLAEEEVNAQKSAIESQIESLDDYMEYVENYYEELLANPRKMIEEIRDLLTGTDSEIIAWLERNHEDYQAATDAAREEMRLGWKEMLDDMRGNTQTYWDEVEQIIAQGDEAIIEFLKQNSADYRVAGKLQAEAYVDEWKEKLEDLRSAYKTVSDEIKSYNYTPTTSSGSSGSSSGGKSSGTKVVRYQATYPAIGSKKGGTLKGYSTEEAARQAAQSKINSICREVGGSSSSMIGQWARSLYSQIRVSAYAKGGIVNTTGLAWLDGTKQKPERVLSPYQTELFEDMVKSLHAIRLLRAPVNAVTPSIQEKQLPQGLNIESITVQVQRLETEHDYEEMAERIGEQIMEKVTRGMVVGGIRIG